MLEEVEIVEEGEKEIDELIDILNESMAEKTVTTKKETKFVYELEGMDEDTLISTIEDLAQKVSATEITPRLRKQTLGLASRIKKMKSIKADRKKFLLKTLSAALQMPLTGPIAKGPVKPFDELSDEIREIIADKVVDLENLRESLDVLLDFMGTEPGLSGQATRTQRLLDKITKAGKVTDNDKKIVREILRDSENKLDKEQKRFEAAMSFMEDLRDIETEKGIIDESLLTESEKEDYRRYREIRKNLLQDVMAGKNIKEVLDALEEEEREWYLRTDRKFQVLRELTRPTRLLGEDISLAQIYRAPPPKISIPQPSEIIERKRKFIKLTPLVPSVSKYLTRQVTPSLRRMMMDILIENFIRVTKEEDVSVEEFHLIEYGLKPWDSVDEIAEESSKFVVRFTFEEKQYEKEFPFSNEESKVAAFQEAKTFAENSYYQENLMQWFRTAEYEAVKASVERDPEIDILVQEELQQMSDPEEILADIEKRYGMGLWTLPVEKLIHELEAPLPGVKVKGIDLHILKALRASGKKAAVAFTTFRIYPNRSAVVVAKAIDDYTSKYLEVEGQLALKSEIIQQKILDILHRIRPSEEQIEEFNALYRPEILKIYRQQLKQYREAEKKSKRSKKFRAKVDEFEKRCYEEATIVDGAEVPSVYSYVLKTSYPLLFLRKPLSDHAKFFEEKVKSKKFDIAALPIFSSIDSHLAIYFPELSMNLENIAPEALGELSKLFGGTIRDVIGVFRSLSQTGEHVLTKPSPPYLFDWTPYLTSVVGKCHVDTGSGLTFEYGGRTGKVVRKGAVLQVLGVTGDPAAGEPWLEPTPLSDVVICYDEESDLFTCHDSKNVIRELASFERPINPYTGKPYSESFVERMRKSYAKQISKAEKLAPIPEEEVEEVSAFLRGRGKEPESLKELADMMIPGIDKIVYFYTNRKSRFFPAWENLAGKYAYMMITMNAEDAGFEEATFAKVVKGSWRRSELQKRKPGEIFGEETGRVFFQLQEKESNFDSSRGMVETITRWIFFTRTEPPVVAVAPPSPEREEELEFADYPSRPGEEEIVRRRRKPRITRGGDIRERLKGKMRALGYRPPREGEDES